MHNQTFLNNYFSEHWDSAISQYIYSGYSILDKILSTQSVIDVGCGTNPFKDKIQNLVGIDPTDVGADIVTTLEDYTPNNKYDVALCLGSINFGSEDIIANQIEKVNSLLNPSARIFWRLNPGLADHDSELCDNIDFYPWTFEKLDEFAIRYGFKQVNCAEDTDGENVRLYAEWIR